MLQRDCCLLSIKRERWCASRVSIDRTQQMMNCCANRRYRSTWSAAVERVRMSLNRRDCQEQCRQEHAGQQPKQQSTAPGRKRLVYVFLIGDLGHDNSMSLVLTTEVRIPVRVGHVEHTVTWLNLFAPLTGEIAGFAAYVDELAAADTFSGAILVAGEDGLPLLERAWGRPVARTASRTIATRALISVP